MPASQIPIALVSSLEMPSVVNEAMSSAEITNLTESICGGESISEFKIKEK